MTPSGTICNANVSRERGKKEVKCLVKRNLNRILFKAFKIEYLKQITAHLIFSRKIVLIIKDNPLLTYVEMF